MHPQLGLLCGAALPAPFFFRKIELLLKNILFYDFQLTFHQHLHNSLLTRGTTIKTGIWPLYNFGRYPKFLKWSSQRRPMNDLVRKSRPKTSRQLSLSLCLHLVAKRFRVPGAPNTNNIFPNYVVYGLVCWNIVESKLGTMSLISQYFVGYRPAAEVCFEGCFDECWHPG